MQHIVPPIPGGYNLGRIFGGTQITAGIPIYMGKDGNPFRQKFHRADPAFIFAVSGVTEIIFNIVAGGKEPGKIFQFQEFPPYPSLAGDHGGITLADLMVKDTPYPRGGTGQDLS
jgi:hypothetical protein